MLAEHAVWRSYNTVEWRHKKLAVSTIRSEEYLHGSENVPMNENTWANITHNRLMTRIPLRHLMVSLDVFPDNSRGMFRGKAKLWMTRSNLLSPLAIVQRRGKKGNQKMELINMSILMKLRTVYWGFIYMNKFNIHDTSQWNSTLEPVPEGILDKSTHTFSTYRGTPNIPYIISLLASIIEIYV